MAPLYVDAFVDESGQRSKTAKSSDHFVLSAVVIQPGGLPAASKLLADMRTNLGRHPGDELHWKNIKTHDQRVRAAQMLGQAGILRISCVVVCKRDFDKGKGNIPDEDFAYMFTFRFLLERISWLARDNGVVVRYTLAQIGAFKLSQLRHYEASLRSDLECSVHWDAIDPGGGNINQPNHLEYLQLADIAASATAQAFEPNRFGNTETRYLEHLAPNLYRYKNSPLTSYGLKMHPWNAKSKAAHPWLDKDWGK